jgi:hypothetical protein
MELLTHHDIGHLAVVDADEQAARRHVDHGEQDDLAIPTQLNLGQQLEPLELAPLGTGRKGWPLTSRFSGHIATSIALQPLGSRGFWGNVAVLRWLHRPPHRAALPSMSRA